MHLRVGDLCRRDLPNLIQKTWQLSTTAQYHHTNRKMKVLAILFASVLATVYGASDLKTAESGYGGYGYGGYGYNGGLGYGNGLGYGGSLGYTNGLGYGSNLGYGYGGIGNGYYGSGLGYGNALGYNSLGYGYNNGYGTYNGYGGLGGLYGYGSGIGTGLGSTYSRSFYPYNGLYK